MKSLYRMKDRFGENVLRIISDLYSLYECGYGETKYACRDHLPDKL